MLQDFTPKISDFGLAKLGPQGDRSHISSRVLGTRGYFAPEYIATGTTNKQSISICINQNKLYIHLDYLYLARHSTVLEGLMSLLLTGHLTMKTDVYSFGVVLLEILSGRVAVNRSYSEAAEDLVEWGKPYLSNNQHLHRIIDKKLVRNFSRKEAFKFAKIIRQCLNRKPKRRPTMTEVVHDLEELEQDMNLNHKSLGNNTKIQHIHSQHSHGKTREQCSTVSFC